MRSLSHENASLGSWANLGPAERQRVLCWLREGIAQDLWALSVHLFVLRGEVESAAFDARIAELQRLAEGALNDIVALAGIIEGVTASGPRAAIGNHLAARRVSERAEVAALRRGNERLKQLAAGLAQPTGGSQTSQASPVRRRARPVIDGLSSR